MRRVSAVVALIVMSGLAACTSGGADSRESEKGKDTPEVEALKFSDTPKWSLSVTGKGPGEVRSGVVSIDDFEMFGNSVLYTGTGASKPDHTLVVADVSSGKEKWQISEKTELGDTSATPDFEYDTPQVAGEGDKTVVAVPYTKPLTLDDGSEGEEQGVAALSAETGKVLWTVQVETGKKYGSHFDLVDATPQRILTEVWNTADSEVDSVRTVVIDVADKSVAWEEDGIGPQGFAGNAVIADKPNLQYGYEAGENPSHSKVAARNATSGKELWELFDFEVSTVTKVGEDSTVVSVSGGIAVIDNASGEEVAKKGADVQSCREAGDLLACSTGGTDIPGPLLMIDASGKKTTISSLKKFTDSRPTYIDDGRIFLTDVDGKSENITIDAAGNTIDKKLPGRLLAINDDYAAFKPEGSDAAVQVHKLGK